MITPNILRTVQKNLIHRENTILLFYLKHKKLIVLSILQKINKLQQKDVVKKNFRKWKIFSNILFKIKKKKESRHVKLEFKLDDNNYSIQIKVNFEIKFSFRRKIKKRFLAKSRKRVKHYAFREKFNEFYEIFINKSEKDNKLINFLIIRKKQLISINYFFYYILLY